MDRDGDLDAFVGKKIFGQIWTNDRSDHFADSDQCFELSSEYTVNLADVDGNGDKDAFAIRFNSEGHGGFTQFGQLTWTGLARLAGYPEQGAELIKVYEYVRCFRAIQVMVVMWLQTIYH